MANGNIREFTNPVQGIRPSSAGPAAYAQIAQTTEQEGRVVSNIIGQTANMAGRVLQTQQDAMDKAAAQKEIMEGSSALNLLDENATSDYLNVIRTADPNDSSIGAAWRSEKLEPQFQSFLDGFKTDAGKAWALSQITSMRNQYSRTISGDALNRANIATVNNYNTSNQTAATNAYNHPDTLDDILGRQRETRAAVLKNSGVSPETAAKLMTDGEKADKEVVQGAILGMARKNPQMLIDKIESGAWKQYEATLGPDGLSQALDLGYRMKAAQAEADRVAKSAAYTDAQRVSADNKAKVILEQYDGKTGTWKYDLDTVNKIMDLPETVMNSADKQATIEKLKSLAGTPDATADTPGLVNDLLKRVSLADSDPNHITTGELLSYVGSTGAKRLTQASFNFIQTQLGGDATAKDFISRQVTAEMNAASSKINPTKGLLGDFILGAGGKQAEDEMRADVLRRLQAAGSGAEQQKLMTPGAKEYLFTEEYLKGWREKAGKYGNAGVFSTPQGAGAAAPPSGSIGSFAPPPKGTTLPPVVAPPAVKPPLLFGVQPGQPAPGKQGSLTPGVDPVRTASIAQETTILTDWANKNDVSAATIKAALTTPEGTLMKPETPNTVQPAPAPTPGALKVVTDQTTRSINAVGYGDKLTGALTVNGHQYNFVSGGGGRGSLPLGTYTVIDYMTGPQRAKAGYEYKADSFMLSDAKDPLLPGQDARRGLLFHALTPGHHSTAGCIGIEGGPEVFKQFAIDLNAEVAANGGFGKYKIQVGPQKA